MRVDAVYSGTGTSYVSGSVTDQKRTVRLSGYIMVRDNWQLRARRVQTTAYLRCRRSGCVVCQLCLRCLLVLSLGALGVSLV